MSVSASRFRPIVPDFCVWQCKSRLTNMEVRIEETKKRIQLESSKDNVEWKQFAPTSSSSPVLSFAAYGERLASRLLAAELPCTIPLPLRTMASRLCVFDSNSNSSAFVAAKPKQVAFVPTLVCAIACESKATQWLPAV